MKIRTRFICGIGLILLLLVGIGTMCMSKMHTLSNLTLKMHRHSLTVGNAVRDVKMNIIAIHETMDDMIIDAEQIDQEVNRVNQLETEIDHEFDLIKERFLGEKTQVTQLISTFETWRPFRTEVTGLLREGIGGNVLQAAISGEKTHLAKLMAEAEALIDFSTNQADRFLNNAEQTRKEAERFMLFLIATGVFVGLGIAIVLSRSIVDPVRAIISVAEKVAAGNLSVNIDMKGQDEISRLGRRFMSMVEEMRKIEALRSDAALSAALVENSTNAIMFCDNDLKLVFMNPASTNSFKKFGHLLPCKPEEMIGRSIDFFHKDPEPIRQLLADETNLPYKGRIVLGDEILLLIATAIYDHQMTRIGTMAIWSLATDNENLMKSLKGSSSMVSSASDELTESSQAMRATAEETSRQAKSVALISEQTNESVQAVAAAAEEMSVTVKEIAKSVQDANQISSNAVSKAKTMNKMIAKLDESGRAIGKIVKVISKIAGQTNLLALNATIEAACAGEAGLGFAVVANEVKALAKETESATSEIRAQITTIQSNTKEAVEAIGEISDIIHQNQEIAIVIAGAVEEQAATTDDIRRNMAGAAQGTDEVVKEIESILNAAVENARGADNIEAAAQQLAQMANQLAGLTGNQSEQLEEMTKAQNGDIELF